MNEMIQTMLNNNIVCGISLIFNIAVILLIFNLFVKISTLKTIIYTFYDYIMKLSVDLDKVDKNGAFRVDDEVGFIFDEILKLIEVFSKNIHKLISMEYRNNNKT